VYTLSQKGVDSTYYLVKGTEIDGNTLKLLGQPTPFLAHELNTDITISRVKFFNLLSNENGCKYITI